jgi:5-methylcytosine-specific restriction protein A
MVPMARTVPEWIGKTDDSMPPDSVKQRIVERQGGVCAIDESAFGPKNKPQFDHIKPLWLDGENRESNLQALSKNAHANKTATEATVRAKVNANKRKSVGIDKKPKRNGFRKAEPQRSATKPLTKRVGVFEEQP